MVSLTEARPASVNLFSIDLTMIPKKFAYALFGLILSSLMSLLVSGITTLRAVGVTTHFLSLWSTAWIAAWFVAFPVVLVLAPLTRRLVDSLTRND